MLTMSEYFLSGNKFEEFDSDMISFLGETLSKSSVQYCVLDQNLGKCDFRIGVQLFTRAENSLKSCFSNINAELLQLVWLPSFKRIRLPAFRLNL